MYLNKACYFAKEAIIETNDIEKSNALQKYSSDLFNHTMKLRTQLNSTSELVELVLLKELFNFQYISTGNDYYFSNMYELEDIACIILLDYFNGKIANKTNNSKKIETNVSSSIKSKIINPNGEKITEDDIIKGFFTWSFTNNKTEYMEYVTKVIKDTSQNDETSIVSERCGFFGQDCRTDTSQEEHENEIDNDRNELFDKICYCNLTLFDNTICANKDSIVFNDNEIILNECFIYGDINFASCQCSTYNSSEYLKKTYYC